MTAPLIELRGVSRVYHSGEQEIRALDAIDLSIEAGEMVAIVGSSGSGKSTLMNVLGCLDRPTAGVYRVAGRVTGDLDADDLAAFRREHFGFIFQRYHLLPRLSALANIELPAIYAGASGRDRHNRASVLLETFGMKDRQFHRPSQLSGGQQQRVSIARALINGGQVILADEPTGALDSHTGEQILATLKSLNAAGHTIILVTHDMAVAGHAERIIELSDGKVVADRRTDTRRAVPAAVTENADAARRDSWRGGLDRLVEAFRIAFLSMRGNRLRTFLTMLGIVIGIASVVAVVALGEGARQYIQGQLSSLGTNTIDILPGTDFGDVWSDRIRTLSEGDAAALGEESYVDSVTPAVTTGSTVRYGNVTLRVTVNGVGEQYFRVHAMKMSDGLYFDRRAVREAAQEAVIDDHTRKTLFKDRKDVLGQVILIGTVPVRVIGVLSSDQPNLGMGGFLYVWMPYTTAMHRLTGQNYIQSFTVRIKDGVPIDAAKDAVQRIMKMRHGRKDFFIQDLDAIRKSIEQTTAAMKLLMSLIAAISLVIGGIGIMNITLVSVTERTQEIGVRMAIGARRSDIRNQFLVEAILICLSGGLIGVLLAFGIGAAVAQITPFQLVFSLQSIVAAFGCSTAIGLLFGFLPARNAARLDPVDALARE
jgi:macrolide transport system ATP-binding/permease protein